MCALQIFIIIIIIIMNPETPGFFYVHYTTHRTYSFTSHPKDEAIMVKCLAQGDKLRTHILTTPELESNALDRSATSLQIVLSVFT